MQEKPVRKFSAQKICATMALIFPHMSYKNWNASWNMVLPQKWHVWAMILTSLKVNFHWHHYELLINWWIFHLASCQGDSGSPVIRRVTDSARGRPYYEQHFIVSDSAVAGRCDAKASLFTRVADRQILTWIQNVKNQSLILLFSLFKYLRNNLTLWF